MLHSIHQQIWKTQQWTQDWKRSVFIPIPQKYSKYCTIAFISHAGKCSKFSKSGFNSTWTENFQMFKLDLEKAEEPEIKLSTSVGSQKKQENFRKKHLLLLYWLCQSLWLCGSQQTGKFFKKWEYQATLPASWQICVQVKKQQFRTDPQEAYHQGAISPIN